MFTDIDIYIPQFENLFDAGLAQISDIKPSAWTEANVIMGKPRPGPFRYDYTPYAKEIIDCLAPDHPARKVAVMKGAQIGFSSGVIYPGIGWLIQNNPGNCYLMVGAPELIPKAMEKLDLLLTNSDLRRYISDQSGRQRKGKTGDTNLKKDFSGGYVSIGSANNHKNIAQVDLQYIFLDDLDQMKGETAYAGGLIKLIEKRAAAYKDIYKMLLISTPLLKQSSLIEPAFLLGDRRRRMVECPNCHEPIIWKRVVAEGELMNNLTGETAKHNGGLIWEKNNHDQVIEKSVGYVCYKCAGWHNDKDKYNQLNGGFWKPTAIPSRDDYFSYHIPSLYAPIGMFDWLQIARDYEECHPEGKRVEKDYRVLVTTVDGETYESKEDENSAKDIQANQRDYAIGIIPETLAERDGNGRIVLLTIGMDCNGTVMGVNGAKENDARIDYQIKAWTETGASYSIKQGSIGTFVPRERSLLVKDIRTKWTYEPGKPNSVWPLVYEIVTQVYKGDKGGNFKINRPGIDVGMYSDYILPFIDFTIGRNPQNPVIGLRGDKELEFVLDNRNLPLFKEGAARKDVFYLQVGFIKDMLSNHMKLRWDRENDVSQPYRFMNFPMSQLYICPVKKKYNDIIGVKYEGDYLYQTEAFFNHYEAEHRAKVVKDSGSEAFRWVKKSALHQNHFWDTDVYNLAIVEICVRKLGKALEKQTKIPAGEFTWTDFVNYMNT